MCLKTLASDSYAFYLREGTRDHFQETFDRIFTSWLPAHAPARTELARDFSRAVTARRDAPEMPSH